MVGVCRVETRDEATAALVLADDWVEPRRRVNLPTGETVQSSESMRKAGAECGSTYPGEFAHCIC